MKNKEIEKAVQEGIRKAREEERREKSIRTSRATRDVLDTAFPENTIRGGIGATILSWFF